MTLGSRRVAATTEVTTAELCAALEAGLGERFGRGCRIVDCVRRPFAFRSSTTLEELDVQLDDGSERAVIFKHIGQHALLDEAQGIRPSFLFDSQREIEAYRRVLGGRGEGTPAFYGAVSEPPANRYWLFLERVDGALLWEYREIEVWRSVARWLAGFHSRCASWAGASRHAGAPLMADAGFYRTWVERAWRFASVGLQEQPARLRRFQSLVESYESVIERLERLPRSLIHGELFASNVLVVPAVDDGPTPLRRVCAVDWECLGFGPGVLDLAAMSAGWEGDDREQIAMAYFEEQRHTGSYSSKERLMEALDLGHLQLAMQMLGWAEDWQPPPEHRQDWLEEALATATRLGVLDAESR